MQRTKTKTAPEVSEAAAALGRIGGKSKSKKKLDAIALNLEKANTALDADARKQRAKKAALARWAKTKAAGKDAKKLD